MTLAEARLTLATTDLVLLIKLPYEAIFFSDLENRMFSAYICIDFFESSVQVTSHKSYQLADLLEFSYSLKAKPFYSTGICRERTLPLSLGRCYA